MAFPTNNPGQPDSTAHDTSELRDDLSILGDEDVRGSEGEEEDDLSDEDASQNDETDKPPVEGEEDSEKDSEDEEESEEDKDKQDEEEEDTTPLAAHARPTVKQIKAKFPDFFKSFPEMRHMLFREQEYTGVFPTVEEAKDASSRAKDFDMFSNLLQSGKREDFGEFLKGVSEAGPDTLTSMAANFLPSVYDTNRDLYFQITTPIAQGLLRNALRAAKQAGNVNLENAALHIAQWALGDTKYATGEMSVPTIQPKVETKDPKLEADRAAFYQEKYDDSRTFVSSNAAKQLTKEVKRGLDPGGVFNEFTSQLLTKNILEELGQRLEGDKDHMAKMNGLWAQAHKAGFVGNWKDRILTTYLSRARTYLPAIRTKIREEALKGVQSRTARVEDIAGRSANRKDVAGSQNSPGRRNTSGAFQPGRKVDYSKTSDLDLLNDKISYR